MKRGRESDSEDELEKEQLLDFIENDNSAAEQIDSQFVKKAILGLEKAIDKNQEMRFKFPDEPMKYVDSELDLNSEIPKLGAVAAMPALYEV